MSIPYLCVDVISGWHPKVKGGEAELATEASFCNTITTAVVVEDEKVKSSSSSSVKENGDHRRRSSSKDEIVLETDL